MTDDIGSDKHRSSPEIKMAILEERMREARERDRVLLDSNAQVLKAVNEINTKLALGEQRMEKIEEDQEDTTSRLLKLEDNKTNVIAHIIHILSQIGLWGAK